VNYGEKNWKLLLIQLVTKPDRIHVLNRAQIVDDACHLSWAGLVPYNYYISLLEYLLMEDHVTPWNTAIDGLSSIMGPIRRYPADHTTFKVRHPEFESGLFLFSTVRRVLKRALSAEIRERLGGSFVQEIITEPDE